MFAARDERLRRAVAIKTILSGVEDHDSVRRFLREARAAASVNHPNVCQIYDVDEHDGGWFLAMELLDGESLERRLERGALPFADALGIARQVLAAWARSTARGWFTATSSPPTSSSRRTA